MDYQKIAATASELLARFGVPVALLRPKDGTHDPLAGTVSGGQVEEIEGSVGVLVSMTKQFRDELGGNVKAGDRVLVLDNANEPRPGDEAMVGTDRVRIGRVLPVAPAGEAIVYRVQASL